MHGRESLELHLFSALGGYLWPDISASLKVIFKTRQGKVLQKVLSVARSAFIRPDLP